MLILKSYRMKVVGAKLDDSDYDRFETFCIDEGLSKSEILRGLIKQYCNACEDCLDEDEQIVPQDLKVKPITEAKIKRVSYDDGKTWIDIPELTNITVSD